MFLNLPFPSAVVASFLDSLIDVELMNVILSQAGTEACVQSMVVIAENQTNATLDFSAEYTLEWILAEVMTFH